MQETHFILKSTNSRGFHRVLRKWRVNLNKNILHHLCVCSRAVLSRRQQSVIGAQEA